MMDGPGKIPDAYSRELHLSSMEPPIKLSLGLPEYGTEIRLLERSEFACDMSGCSGTCMYEYSEIGDNSL